VFQKVVTADQGPTPTPSSACCDEISALLYYKHKYSAIYAMSKLQQLQDFFVFTLSPSLPAIIFTFILAITLPLLLHSYTFRKRDAANLPAFLLVGPSGAGKTAMLTLVSLWRVVVR